MIVDFYGSPGAGKTYLVHQLQNKPVTVKEETKLKRAVLKIAKGMVRVLPSTFLYQYKMNAILADRQAVPQYNMVPVKKYISNIAMVASGYALPFMKNRIYDEGLIHRIISGAINYGLGVETAIRMIHIFDHVLKNVETVYLYVPVDECFWAIEKRNRHECGIDELEKEELMKFLCEYKEYCDEICKNYHHMRIHRNEISMVKTRMEEKKKYD